VVSFRDLVTAFREAGLNDKQPVIVHSSLSAVGDIRGGAGTVFGAMHTIAPAIMVPTFTYKTMITPEVGPADNAITYGSGKDLNRMAEFFRADMPADPLMGIFPETIRRHPGASRSSHPILSFAGLGVDTALQAQTLEEPLAPLGVMSGLDALVVLIGVDHTANTSIHYAERLAGRKQFVRWALTAQGVRACPGFCGCSSGFEQAAACLRAITRVSRAGRAAVRVVPLQPMIEILTGLIREQPLALLCSRGDERCEAIRRWLMVSPTHPTGTAHDG
jgi:aminoglycoside 3-N-acetyltransferase